MGELATRVRELRRKMHGRMLAKLAFLLVVPVPFVLAPLWVPLPGGWAVSGAMSTGLAIAVLVRHFLVDRFPSSYRWIRAVGFALMAGPALMQVLPATTWSALFLAEALLAGLYIGAQLMVSSDPRIQFGSSDGSVGA